MLSLYFPGKAPAVATADKQSGKRSASAAAHVTRVSDNRRTGSCVSATLVRRTTWRCPRSASAVSPVAARQDLCAGLDRTGWPGDLEKDERARACAVVHAIVDETRVTPHADALARRLQIRLVCDRVLEVAQVVTGVRDRFEQRYLQI